MRKTLQNKVVRVFIVAGVSNVVANFVARRVDDLFDRYGE